MILFGTERMWLIGLDRQRRRDEREAREQGSVVELTARTDVDTAYRPPPCHYQQQVHSYETH